MVVAKSSRASRAARPPPASDSSIEAAWARIHDSASKFEAKNLHHIERVAPTTWRQDTARGFKIPSAKANEFVSNEEQEATSVQSHIFSLQSRGVTQGYKEQSFLSYKPIDDLRDK